MRFAHHFHTFAHHVAVYNVLVPRSAPTFLARLKTGTERTAFPLSLSRWNWFVSPVFLHSPRSPLHPILGTPMGHTAATYLLGFCVGHGVLSGCLWVHRWLFTIFGCEWCRETLGTTPMGQHCCTQWAAPLRTQTSERRRWDSSAPTCGATAAPHGARRCGGSKA